MLRTIDDILEAIDVMPPGMWANPTGPEDWYSVVTDQGIVAYAADETLACKIRLWLVNDLLNTIPESILGLKEDTDE